jgi:hypothetical protein
MLLATQLKYWRRYLFPSLLVVGALTVLLGALGVARQVSTSSSNPSPNPVLSPAQSQPATGQLTPPLTPQPSPSLVSTPQLALGTAPKLPLSVGIGLSGIADWSTQNPFIDAFKSSRAWLPQCGAGEPGCAPEGEWDTNEAKLIDLDANGWVRSLPAVSDAPRFTKVGTLLFRGIGNRYPAGRYLVLYDGEGKLEYDYVQKDEAASRPGRDVIISDASDAGIYLVISQTDPKKTGNYLRNIRVIPETYATRYQAGEIFHPNFLDKITPFKTLRMMDWMATNYEPPGVWQNRPRVEQASYAYRGGVPMEVMVRLANQLKIHPWFTMPHTANDEYVRNFASYVRDNLDPSLKVYIEYSNEVWNGLFEQHGWANTQGKARLGANADPAFMKWYGLRSAQVAQIWKQTFAAKPNGRPDRVIAVFATQAASQGLEAAGLEVPVAPGQPAAKFFDAYAIAPYLGSELGAPDQQAKVKAWLKDADGGFGKLFRQLRQGDVLSQNPQDRGRSLPQILAEVRYHQQVAQKYGYSLVAYEGGQHLSGFWGVENDDALTNFFIAANRRPEMYQLYQDLLQGWKQLGGTTFMHFVDIGQPDKWGSWGALEYATQPGGSPKYNALIDFIRKNTN